MKGSLLIIKSITFRRNGNEQSLTVRSLGGEIETIDMTKMPMKERTALINHLRQQPRA